MHHHQKGFNTPFLDNLVILVFLFIVIERTLSFLFYGL
jgi:hypothetical protein